MSYLDNERLQSVRIGQPGHAVFRRLSRRIGSSAATTYFVLRQRGMTATEAWTSTTQERAATSRDQHRFAERRGDWKNLPLERLRFTDRLHLAHSKPQNEWPCALKQRLRSIGS